MTWEEETADDFGITEPHDENCHGDYMCREHFIGRLTEVRKKEEADPTVEPLLITGFRIPGAKGSGSSVDVELGKTLLFTWQRPLRIADAAYKTKLMIEHAVVDWIKATRAADFRRADEMKARLERMGVPDAQKWINDQRGL